MSDIITQQQRAVDPQNRPAQLDYILLDASGSMTGKRDDSLNAIDNFVDQLRAESVNSNVVVASFTSGHDIELGSGLNYTIQRECQADAWQPMRYDGSLVLGGGSTPLYDAINMLARDCRNRLPQKCSVIIITDGEENASKTTVEQAKAMLDWMRSMGWQITFLGANFENSQQAKLLGADASNSVGVDVKRLVDATSLLAQKRARYSRYGTDMNMSDDEKSELGGYLADHSGGK
jgi:uncharacterized protein YegL